MSKQDIDDTLKDLLVDRLFLDVEPEDIDSTTPLADYGVDSFLLVEMIVGIEEEFGVQFQQSDINAETLSTVAAMRQLILSKQ